MSNRKPAHRTPLATQTPPITKTPRCGAGLPGPASGGTPSFWRTPGPQAENCEASLCSYEHSKLYILSSGVLCVSYLLGLRPTRNLLLTPQHSARRRLSWTVASCNSQGYRPDVPPSFNISICEASRHSQSPTNGTARCVNCKKNPAYDVN